jgi:hypothetical protein
MRRHKPPVFMTSPASMQNGNGALHVEKIPRSACLRVTQKRLSRYDWRRHKSETE